MAVVYYIISQSYCLSGHTVSKQSLPCETLATIASHGIITGSYPCQVGHKGGDVAMAASCQRRGEGGYEEEGQLLEGVASHLLDQHSWQE